MRRSAQAQADSNRDDARRDRRCYPGLRGPSLVEGGRLGGGGGVRSRGGSRCGCEGGTMMLKLGRGPVGDKSRLKASSAHAVAACAFTYCGGCGVSPLFT